MSDGKMEGDLGDGLWRAPSVQDKDRGRPFMSSQRLIRGWVFTHQAVTGLHNSKISDMTSYLGLVISFSRPSLGRYIRPWIGSMLPTSLDSNTPPQWLVATLVT